MYRSDSHGLNVTIMWIQQVQNNFMKKLYFHIITTWKQYGIYIYMPYAALIQLHTIYLAYSMESTSGWWKWCAFDVNLMQILYRFHVLCGCRWTWFHVDCIWILYNFLFMCISVNLMCIPCGFYVVSCWVYVVPWCVSIVPVHTTVIPV